MVPNALEEARSRKTLEMERSVSYLRALVIGFNVVVYLTLIGLDTPRAPLAIAIILIAVPYAVWSVVGRPYLRYPLLRFGALTLSSDVVLITLWIYGTGGAHSEFWIIYVVSVVSVAMRYDLKQTVGAAIAEAAVYASVAAIDGLRGASLAVRPGYIVICGIAAGFLARMERINREERLAAQELASENARLLARERETVERLRDLDKLKSEFVASASHELRTPLTTLSGFAITLSERRADMTDADVQSALDAMGRQGERTRALIENLLDLSRLEARADPLSLKPVKIGSAARAALEAAPPPPEVDVSVEVDEDVTALADPEGLEQVLANLLTNAYRYGGHLVRIVCSAGDDVTIAVEDDGVGVLASDVAILFEPFSRGTNVNGSAGSGLGLTISARLVQAFGGTLVYEPLADGGSSFKMSLPRV